MGHSCVRGAKGETRTLTGCTHWYLKPARLPVPPLSRQPERSGACCNINNVVQKTKKPVTWITEGLILTDLGALLRSLAWNTRTTPKSEGGVHAGSGLLHPWRRQKLRDKKNEGDFVREELVLRIGPVRKTQAGCCLIRKTGWSRTLRGKNMTRNDESGLRASMITSLMFLAHNRKARLSGLIGLQFRASTHFRKSR